MENEKSPWWERFVKQEDFELTVKERENYGCRCDESTEKEDEKK